MKKQQIESNLDHTTDNIAESKDISTLVDTNINANDNISNTNTNTSLIEIDTINHSSLTVKTKNLNHSNSSNSVQKQGLLLKPISDPNNFIPKARNSEYKFVENYQKSLRKVSPDELEKVMSNLVTPKGLQKVLKEKKGDQKVFYHYFIDEKLHN